jgi:hypothetical protein
MLIALVGIYILTAGRRFYHSIIGLSTLISRFNVLSNGKGVPSIHIDTLDFYLY